MGGVNDVKSVDELFLKPPIKLIDQVNYIRLE